MSTHRLKFWPSVVAVSFFFMHMGEHCSSPTSLKAQGHLRLANDPPSRARSRLTEFETEDGRLLRRLEQENAVYQQRVEAEVNAGLRTARDRMGVDSEGAIRYLKILHQMLHRAIDLDNEVRTRLLHRIEAAMREASRRSVEESSRRMRAQQNRAEAIERLRQVDRKDRDEIKISQLMQRFNSLKAEGRFREAEEVAVQIRQLDPKNPIVESIVQNARFANNIATVQSLRELKEKRFLETLHQVELSSIPFPDNRPMVYPPAEKWRNLTRKRAIGLDQASASEERIRNALRQKTRLEFVETPLQDAVEYLSELHDIPIVIDTRALELVGFGSDTLVTKELKGISLRSALNLLLRDLELTYMIQDEVLQITTPEVAEANVKTKIYPLSDLLTPTGGTTVNPFAPGGR